MKGQVFEEILMEEEEESSQTGKMPNGMQVAWMLRRKLDIGANEGALVTERELIELQLEQDNVPKVLKSNGLDQIGIRKDENGHLRQYARNFVLATNRKKCPVEKNL